ncbi:MAG: hypothetical protein IKK32_06510 [Oscillospiraceae bacterium]|nr:hypothetical protein [Oscillospiraceae bacterium]
MKLKKILLVITAMSVMLCGCSKAEPSSSDNNNGNNDVTVSEETTENNVDGENISYGDGISDEDTVLDVFENIRLSYEGFSPDISVSVDTSKMRGFLQDNVTYTVKPDSELKNGDKVIVTAMYNNSVMKSHDYVVKKDVLEMTIDGADIPEEDVVVIDGEMLKRYAVISASPSYTNKGCVMMGGIFAYEKGNDLPRELSIEIETEEGIKLLNRECSMDEVYKKSGEIVTFRVYNYDREYAQANGYLITEDASFDVIVWHPEDMPNLEGYMYYEDDGSITYSYYTPKFD